MEFDLVLEGGGAKGMAFVGAMQVFEQQGHTYSRLLGTSAGAITAALMAADYGAEEMMNTLLETGEDGRSVFNTFLGVPESFAPEEIAGSATAEFLRAVDIPVVPEWLEEKLDRQIIQTLMEHPRFRHLFSFVERGGWFSADPFVEWLARRLDSGTFRGRPRRFGAMTLAAFFAATGRELTLVAADTSASGLMILNHRTAPDCPLVWAVRMSMSVPLLWQEVVWEPAWGTYRGRTVAGHRVVDGGMLSNFPLELFVSQDEHITAVMGPKTSERVLGFLIDEATPVDAPAPRIIDPLQLRTVQRIRRLLNTMMLAHDKMVMDALVDLVVRLPAGGFGTVEFDMSPARRDALLAAARESTSLYFARHPQGAPGERGDLRKREETRRAVDRIATGVLQRADARLENEGR